MNLILCGLPFVGKSSIGKTLAEMRFCPFIDTDRLVEKIYVKKTGTSKTCRELYLEHGEEVFRRFESEAIANLKEAKTSVIALGGGSLLKKENQGAIQSIGALVYLKTDVNNLWNRIEKSPLPSYLKKEDPKKSFLEIASIRIPLYTSLSQLIVEIDSEDPSQIAKKIYDWYLAYGK